jgi:PAS domain S-box-containing protein
MVELMIFSFGGHQSIYYAGMIIVLVFILGFVPLSLRMTLLAFSSVYAIYFVPIMLFDNITNVRVFINNNVFLMAFVFGGFAWRYYNNQILTKKLSLEYDLSKEKEQLKVYSTQLEELVQERTKELAISEKWHRSIFDNATDGIMVLDKNGVIMNVNQKACEIHGFDCDALIGINTGLLEAGNNKEKHDERMSRILNGDTLIFETEHYKKDGSKTLLEISAKSIDIGGETYIQSFYRDITEKKKIQEQLMHSQKMDSIGALAGGIAHNFNNILTSILGYSELLLEYSNIDETSRQRVKNIESSSRKAGVMVSKLLSFARREVHEVLPLNLNDIVSDCVKLFEGVLNKRIGLKIDLYNNLPSLQGDPNQLEQVIMNLMVNARDAMPDGGLLSLRTNLAEIGKENPDISGSVAPGKYVVLTVSDTGCGINRDIMNKIFDPFFTTKEKGKGTGLGLASVYGIIKDHKGYISVRSEVGKGTTFDIFIPSSEKIVHKISKSQPVTLEGHENILVIDDDKDVLKLIKDILETSGYDVMPFDNPLTAIDMFNNFYAKIQLVITDIMMPLMEGDELIRRLKEIKPDIKIIVVSGYSNERITIRKMVDAVVKKPFERLELLSIVRQLIDTEARSLPLY